MYLEENYQLLGRMLVYEHYQEWDRWLKRIDDLIKRVVHLYLNHLDALKNKLKTI
jgi:hypothetical protein